MENKFKYEKNGYHFVEEKSMLPYRPYRVRCIETGDVNESAISYIDAANLILSLIDLRNGVQKAYSSDVEKIKKLFEKTLLKRNKFECDELVKEEIEGHINGEIEIIDSERFSEEKKYLTEYFEVTVLFEKGWKRPATSIIVNARKDVKDK